jgi:hypothetical protein
MIFNKKKLKTNPMTMINQMQDNVHIASPTFQHPKMEGGQGHVKENQSTEQHQINKKHQELKQEHVQDIEEDQINKKHQELNQEDVQDIEEDHVKHQEIEDDHVKEVMEEEHNQLDRT